MKHIKLFEQFLNENTVPKIKDLINSPLAIEVGSGTNSKQKWSQSEIEAQIEEVLMHYFFDWEFYFNWTDNGKEYKSFFEKDTIQPLMKNINNTLKKYFILGKHYSGAPLLNFNMQSNQAQIWRDKWFQTSGVPSDIKKEYYNYREEYAGVKLK